MKINQLRNGMYVERNGELMYVFEFKKNETGMEVTFIHTKTREIVAVQLTDKDEITEVYPEKHGMILTDKSDNVYSFMDTNTYNIYEMETCYIVKEVLNLSEGEDVDGVIYNGKLYEVTPHKMRF